METEEHIHGLKIKDSPEEMVAKLAEKNTPLTKIVKPTLWMRFKMRLRILKMYIATKIRGAIGVTIRLQGQRMLIQGLREDIDKLQSSFIEVSAGHASTLNKTLKQLSSTQDQVEALRGRIKFYEENVSTINYWKTKYDAKLKAQEERKLQLVKETTDAQPEAQGTGEGPGDRHAGGDVTEEAVPQGAGPDAER